MKKLTYTIILILALYSQSSFGQANKEQDEDFLILKNEEESFSYIDKNGKVIIPPNTYQACFTDTFRTYAIVLDQEEGFIAIDRNQSFLYKIFVFDNGPDDASEGLFRIIKDGKIGFANEKNGEIIIEPKYEAAYPFENGKAKVALKASKKSDGEHYTWESDEWYFIKIKL